MGLLRLLCYVCTLFVGMVGIFVWCCLAIVFYNCCLVGWCLDDFFACVFGLWLVGVPVGFALL